MHALERGAAGFVERRMNASVRRMMAGRGIDEIAPPARTPAAASTSPSDTGTDE